MRDQKVTVVEPSDILQQQTALKLSNVDFRIDVTTIKRLYEDGGRADVIILNEYDQIINESSYLPRQTGLKGLWELKGRKVFAFSATSSLSHERLLSNCI